MDKQEFIKKIAGCVQIRLGIRDFWYIVRL